MDAIAIAVRDIKLHVPRPILEAVFRDFAGHRGRQLVSIDSVLTQTIIRGRVLTDCSLLGGDEMTLPLTAGQIEQVDNQTLVTRFSKAATFDRTILTVLGIEFTNPAATAWMSPVVGTSQSPHMLQVAKMMTDVHAPSPSTFTSRAIIIGENAVMVTGFTAPPANFHLRCILEYSESMNSLNPRYYLIFSKLCVLATKAHIFNAYEIEVAEAQLSAGRELSKFGEIIGRYESASEDYSEFLSTKWAKIAFMNDQTSYHALLRGQVRGC